MANEKRLIDRNEIFPNGTFFANAEDPLKSLDELIARIWSIPTVDAVEVPCKIGQTVYVFNGLWVSNYVVTHFWYDGRFFKFKAINEEYAYECRDFSFFDERIGKTVFFTYEQAESALKKMYGVNDDGKSL